MTTQWRLGRKVPVNVYDGDGDGARPVCQCHTVEDAKLIVAAVNEYLKVQETALRTVKLQERDREENQT